MNLDKKPFPSDRFWFWGSEDDKDPTDPDSDDMLLPPDIYARLKGKKTYPNCKIYLTKEAALEDLRQALERLDAVEEKS